MANPESETHTIKHQHASGGTYVDTETTIKFYTPNPNQVHVTVECLPGLNWWSCPNAKTLRGWVDEAIAGHGVKRDGARYERNDGRLNCWYFTYYLTAK